MVETFKHGLDPVRKRFEEQGRLMPTGLVYVDSWFTADGATCYQLMQATDVAAFAPWVEAWEDLVAFQISEVKRSADFWSEREL